MTNPDTLGAEWMENFLPTVRGLKVRGGVSRAAYVESPVKTMFPFVTNNSEFFAATDNDVYDITALTPETKATPAASGFSSGDWSHQQIGITGGARLLIANGTDHMQVYDGVNMYPLVDEQVNTLAYDAATSAFVVGETLTGGTSGATAEILGLRSVTATTGSVHLGAITGTFLDNEAITSTSGGAVSNGVPSVAQTATITGVETDAISHVWLYRSRIYMIQKDTLKVWFLPTAQIGGAAQDLDLGGVFRRGGTLLFGATWSLDAGDGQDDKMVIFSSEGEVAVYQGSNPAEVSEWNLIGRYDIPTPVGKRASITAGGDLVVATKDGVVPLSAVVQKDPAALSLSAVSRPVEQTWRDETLAISENIEIHKWTEEDLLLSIIPGSNRMLTANLETGAWCPQSGWFGNCGGEFNGNFFIGRDDGRIYKINDTGTDDGEAFTARVCFSFSDFGDATIYKVPRLMRASFFASGELGYQLGISSDYSVSFGSAPDATVSAQDAMVWGVSNWGEKPWGGSISDPSSGRVDLYRSVSGPGFALAPTMQITSGGVTALNVEFLAIDMIFESGGRAA